MQRETGPHYSTISRVALITSMDVFFTMFVSTWVFRIREKLTAPIEVLYSASVGSGSHLEWLERSKSSYDKRPPLPVIRRARTRCPAQRLRHAGNRIG
jgi:hypothetical protein